MIDKLKIIELFGGIGACSKALTNLKIDYQVVDYVEIDKFAVKSYNAIHETNFETQDITKWDKNIYADLIIGGFPCQDISIAGLQKGIIKGETRSGLMYEMQRVIQKVKPKYVITENVKNFISKKFKPQFDDYLQYLESIGYKNYWQVMNAKDYGIPQNRERVFIVSVRSDINLDYKFPQSQQLQLKLKDMLEVDVGEKYYLSEEKIKIIAGWKSQGRPLKKVHGLNDISRTITARSQGDNHGQTILINNTDETIDVEALLENNAEKSYLEAKNKLDTINEHYSQYSKNKILKNIVDNDIVETITANAMQSFDHNNCHIIKNNLRIRKLTPLECFRLMGFNDNDFYKAQQVNSNSQLYKQAGNSIVVNVLEEILKQIFNSNN
ncbi:MAG: DNA (cytosine-5-)-methyltransferase [Bacilli bacterium]